MSTKRCTKCGIEKDLSEFYRNKGTKDGHLAHCKKCHNEYVIPKTKENYDKRVKYIDSLKTRCVKCGEDRPWVIQFHHVDPSTKSFNITAPSRGLDNLKRESLKCVCLCSNCHDEFHYFFGKEPENPKQALSDFLDDNY